MNQDKDRKTATAPAPDHKPADLPGPNREAETIRVGEALAPGTIPEEERRDRERRKTSAE